jgi:tetratricopeptide (TPR) repeat protein
VLVYSPRDAGPVSDLAATLNAAGVQVWFDRWELAPGHAWVSAIRQAIDASRAIGVCIGQQMPGSFDLDLMAAARQSSADDSLAIFPILLPGADLSTIPQGLRDLSSIDLRRGLEASSLDRLVAAINVRARPEPTRSESLGDARRAAGDFVGALEQYQRALREHGPEGAERDSESVGLLGKLGATYGDLARYDEAEAALLLAVQLGDPTTDASALGALGSLAEMYRARGDLTRARELLERVLQASIELFGQEDATTLTAVSNLAGVLRDAGDVAQARELQSVILDARIRTLGVEHPSTLTAMSNLAGTLWDQGELLEARRLNETILDVRIRTLGPEHPSTLTSKNNLASTLRSQGDLAGARTLQEQVLQARERTLGPEHPDTLRARTNLDALRNER